MPIKWHIHLQHQKGLCKFLESWEKLKSPDSEQIAALPMCISSFIALSEQKMQLTTNWAWAVVSTVIATTKILYNRGNKSWVGNLHVCTVLQCCKNAKINFSDFFCDVRLSQNQWYLICFLFNPPYCLGPEVLIITIKTVFRLWHLSAEREQCNGSNEREFI